MSDVRSRTLITTTDLAARLDAGLPVVVLHVRDDGPIPHERQLIPGAICVCLATDFSGAPSPHAGKRPLPEIVDLQLKARSWGINSDSLIVVYDDNSGAQASRAWWTLRWAGCNNVRLLDGGLKHWVADGRSTANAPGATAPGGGTVVLRVGNMPTIDADQAARLARESVLLDARATAAYCGAPVAAGKPASGHIPGAFSAPAGECIAGDGRFKPSEEMRARFAALSVAPDKPVAVYCGSGNAAAHLIAALHATGLEAALFVGSWSAWSSDPARPAANGPEPG